MRLHHLGLVLLVLVGCEQPAHHYQRFVIVTDPTKIGPDIPPGALALDTQTGNVCFTLGGPFTKEQPGVELCNELVAHHP